MLPPGDMAMLKAEQMQYDNERSAKKQKKKKNRN